MSFGRKGVLKKHIQMVHEQTRKFECEICMSPFGLKSDLKRHVQSVHQKKRPFVCTICAASFGRRSDLKRHTLSLHPGAELPPNKHRSSSSIVPVNGGGGSRDAMGMGMVMGMGMGMGMGVGLSDLRFNATTRIEEQGGNEGYGNNDMGIGIDGGGVMAGSSPHLQVRDVRLVQRADLNTGRGPSSLVDSGILRTDSTRHSDVHDDEDEDDEDDEDDNDDEDEDDGRY